MLSCHIVFIDMRWMSYNNGRAERIYYIVAGDFAILDVVLKMNAIKSGKPNLTVKNFDVPSRIDHYSRRRYVIPAVECLMPVYVAGEVNFVHYAALNRREAA